MHWSADGQLDTTDVFHLQIQAQTTQAEQAAKQAAKAATEAAALHEQLAMASSQAAAARRQVLSHSRLSACLQTLAQLSFALEFIHRKQQVLQCL